jgi:hypothetical protein
MSATLSLTTFGLRDRRLPDHVDPQSVASGHRIGVVLWSERVGKSTLLAVCAQVGCGSNVGRFAWRR